MCGRFTLLVKDSEIASIFSVKAPKMNLPRYNIVPTNLIPFIFYDEEIHIRECMQGEWGLIPKWSRNPFAQTARFINARAETVMEKPSFRELFESQRCLIPVSGFYEWVTKPAHPKQPYYFYLRDQKVFCFAGLWEMTAISPQKMIFTLTIITTQANDKIEFYHHRMPVIIDPLNYSKWLGENFSEKKDISSLLNSRSLDLLACHAVDRQMNSPQHDHPDCIQPINNPF